MFKHKILIEVSRMDKYISREDVLDIVSQYCTDDDGSCSKADVDLREMLDEIEALPDADVQPVKRGRWEQAKNGDEEYLYLSTILGIPVEDLPKYAYCSECHFSFATKGTDKTGNTLIHKAIYRYCPNCGARMDSEQNV